MRTHKETFNGADSFDTHPGRGNGLEQMIRDEVAQQVADTLRNI